VDEHGHKMSKSLGNGIEPQDIMKTLGADILRLWIASADYSNEMSLSQEILKRNADAYRRLRNTARFLLGNLNGFDPAAHLRPLDDMVALDRWIVHRAWEVQEKIKAAYERYDFAEIVQALLIFCSVDLGSLYLDVTKDRLYTMREDSRGRRSAQSAMYRIAEAFTRWIAPVLSFTADEMWAYLPGERKANVLFATWYDGLAPLPTDEASAEGLVNRKVRTVTVRPDGLCVITLLAALHSAAGTFHSLAAAWISGVPCSIASVCLNCVVFVKIRT
jgi:isoleucyl-tRNA synthetase